MDGWMPLHLSSARPLLTNGVSYSFAVTWTPMRTEQNGKYLASFEFLPSYIYTTSEDITYFD